MRLPWVKSKKTRNTLIEVANSASFCEQRLQSSQNLKERSHFWMTRVSESSTETNILDNLLANKCKQNPVAQQSAPAVAPTKTNLLRRVSLLPEQDQTMRGLQDPGAAGPHRGGTGGVVQKNVFKKNDWSNPQEVDINFNLKQVQFQKTKGWWSKWTACVISELRVFYRCFFWLGFFRS